MNTVEVEHKVLDVNPETIAEVMKTIGAKQVYDGVRTITYFDHPDGSLRKNGEGIKLTEEDKLKLEHTRKVKNGQSDTVKLLVSRKEETVEFLGRLNLVPITRVQARRISYELGTIDFDIDCFPGIPPFMEVDMADANLESNELLDKLSLAENEVMIATTPEIFAHYGKNYFVEFSLTRI